MQSHSSVFVSRVRRCLSSLGFGRTMAAPMKGDKYIEMSHFKQKKKVIMHYNKHSYL